ncbi:hypothetical protein ACFL17_07455 [Pseudomonadota bacterium]
MILSIAAISRLLPTVVILFLTFMWSQAVIGQADIGDVSPGEGTRGTEVIITGTGFGTARKPIVKLTQPGVRNKYALNVKSFTDDKIVATIVNGKAGIYDLLVRARRPASKDTFVGGFEIKLPEDVTVDPLAAAVRDWVVVTAKYLGSSIGVVRLNGSRLNIKAWNPVAGTFTFRIPAGTPNGPHDLSIKNGAGFMVAPGALVVAGDPDPGAGDFGATDDDLLKVVSAVATSNTEVLVQFSKPLNPIYAQDPANYRITMPVTGNDGGMSSYVQVVAAELIYPSLMTVRLTTLSQSDLAYTLKVTNLYDLDGLPLAPPEGQDAVIDPTKTEFAGIPPSGAVIDTDGDGLSDASEQRGWLVIISKGEQESGRFWVTSDPYEEDTDGDGVHDAEEKHGRLNPRNGDTDGDTLSDNDEWNVIYSDPANQDTDADGTQDGVEIAAFRSSPILADTDGDQISDTDEVLSRNRDPRIADLPLHGIRIGEVRLQIDERYTYEDVQGDTLTSESSSNVSLAQGESSFESEFLHNHWDILFELSAGVSSQYQPTQSWPNYWGARGEIGGGQVWGTDEGSASESQRVREESLAKIREFNTTSTVTREVVGAGIDVDVTIENRGDLAFSITNLEITVLQRSRESTRRFVPVATLIANSTLISGEPATFNLGPFTPERGPILFSSRDVFPKLIDEMMQLPADGLIFEVVNYDIVDEYGRNFSFSNQIARDRTGLIAIDFGGGDYRRNLVATALQPDPDGFAGPAGDFVGGFNPDGSPKGIPLDFALQDIMELTKSGPNIGITAGIDQVVDSIAQGDDVQLIPQFTTGVGADSIVISPGANRVLESDPLGDDQSHGAKVDGITAGLNQVADSFAQGDDVQLIPPYTTGISVGSIVVSAGQNGVLETSAFGDDEEQVTTGYETSRVCSPPTNTVPSFNPGAICSMDTDCDRDSANDELGSCSGPETLVRFGSQRTGDFDRQWVVLTSREIPAGAEFGEIIVEPGHDLVFAFVQDLDQDGIFAHEEFFAGSTDSSADNFINSSFGIVGAQGVDGYPLVAPTPGEDGIPDSKDTDRDGLGDFAEIRVGWKVSADGGLLQQVYPSPRLPDSDGDGLLDPQEQDLRSFCAVSDPREDALCSYQSWPVVAQTDAIAIIAGLNGIADSLTINDDEQLVPSGEIGLTFATPIIGPGANGILDSILAADDEYQSSASSTRIPPTSNPILSDTDLDAVEDFPELTGFTVGVSIRDGGNDTAETLAIGDDVQQTYENGPVFPGGIVVLPGPNGIVDSCGPPLSLTDLLTCDGDDQYHDGDLVKTDPLRRDTDSDLVSDGRELAKGGDPTDPNDGDEFRDSDQDGLSDAEESVLGWLVSVNSATPYPVLSNPSRPDSDYDGLPDLAERVLGTDPNRSDTDGDDLSDYDEIAGSDFAKFFGLDAEFPGFFIDGANSMQYGTNPNKTDTDEDTLTDDYEVKVGYRVLLGGEPAFRQIYTNPLVKDTDLDGVDDNEERKGKGTDAVPSESTDATDPDTDDDGRTDGLEKSAGTDPLVPDVGVTIFADRLTVDKISDAGGTPEAELAWWFTVQKNTLAPDLLSSARDVQFAIQDPIVFGRYSGEAVNCIGLGKLPAGTHPIAFVLNKSKSYSLKQGDYITVRGIIAEFDSATDDCGAAPNYIPQILYSGCATHFSETFTYEDFLGGGQANLPPPNGQGTVEDCEWEVEIRVFGN